jgi:shikimate dehydrogenase
MTALSSTDVERRLAVLGSPIAHSKSPTLHAAAYAVLRLPWRYEAADVRSDALEDYIGSRDTQWRGLSLTMPLKQTVLPLVGSLDQVARLTGAANTVLFDDGTLRGFNTDVAGIIRCLAAAGLDRARYVHILGGGATAASALVSAAELGAEEVLISVRAIERAAHLAELGSTLGLIVDVREFADARDRVAADLVVSTLPGGAEPGISFTVEERVAAFLLDVAYDPWPSRLALSWESAGGSGLSGLAMLVHQALLQVRIFVSGDPLEPLPDEDVVLAAMLASVGLGADGRPV